MGFFDRLGRLVRANANAAVSSMEDPSKILDQSVADMQSDLVKLRQAVALAIASQKRLRSQAEQASSQATTWYERAELALKKGEEDLAREALVRGDHAEVSRLMDENYDLRASICDLSPTHVQMIETARRCGVSAKFAGSGGAIVGCLPPDADFAALTAAVCRGPVFSGTAAIRRRSSKSLCRCHHQHHQGTDPTEPTVR